MKTLFLLFTLMLSVSNAFADFRIRYWEDNRGNLILWPTREPDTTLFPKSFARKQIKKFCKELGYEGIPSFKINNSTQCIGLGQCSIKEYNARFRCR